MSKKGVYETVNDTLTPFWLKIRDWRLMELHQLRAFITIAKTSNLTRASEALHISQSAVSAKIKGLEQELGVNLFDRSGQGMALTEAGKILLDEAVHAVAAAGSVVERATFLREDGMRAYFKIGTITEPTMLRLGAFSSRLFIRYPNIKLSLQQAVSGQVIERVQNEQYDAGYVIGDVDDNQLSAIPIAPITLRIVAPATWREKILGAGWSDLSLLPWIATPEYCSFNRITEIMFRRHGLSPHFIMEADQEIALKDLVASGVGITLLREDIAQTAEAKGEIAIWPGPAESSMIHFIYLKKKGEMAATRAIVDVIKSVWQP